ncbi:MAG TPA: hypothetical protein VFW49_14900 [Fluviicoccus sp.]|nr:hypothetical protein [Fluviicoccus sp.]
MTNTARSIICWQTWAQANGYVHYGYKAGKPLLMKLPIWARPWGSGI